MNFDDRKSEFISLGMSTPDFTEIVEKLVAIGVDLTPYSGTKQTLEKVRQAKTDEELQAIAKIIDRANREQKDIEDIFLMMELEKEETDGLERFWEMWRDKRNGWRLFMLLGVTGSGKTTAIIEENPDILTYVVTEALDPYTLCFNMADLGDGLKPHPTPFFKAMTEGREVFFDEFSEANQDMRMFTQAITDKKTRVTVFHEEIDLHPDFRIITASNPPSETDERIPFGDALMRRAIVYVMWLFDEQIIERLDCSQEYLDAIRELFNHVRNSGLTDVRDLDYGDYEKFLTYSVKEHMLAKATQNEKQNFYDFTKITQTGEYQNLYRKVLQAIKNLKNAT